MYRSTYDDFFQAIATHRAEAVTVDVPPPAPHVEPAPPVEAAKPVVHEASHHSSKSAAVGSGRVAPRTVPVEKAAPIEHPPLPPKPVVTAPVETAPSVDPQVEQQVERMHTISGYLDKVSTAGDSSQAKVEQAASKLKDIEQLIEARGKTGNPMTENEVNLEMEKRFTPDEVVAVVPANHSLDAQIRVDSSGEGHSFKYWNKELNKEIYYYNQGQEFALQDNDHLIIHDIASGTTRVVSLEPDPSDSNKVLLLEDREVNGPPPASPQDLTPPGASASGMQAAQ